MKVRKGSYDYKMREQLYMTLSDHIHSSDIPKKLWDAIWQMSVYDMPPLKAQDIVDEWLGVTTPQTPEED